MLTSWRDWRLPRVRWLYTGIYLVAGIVAIVVGAGAASVLIGVIVGLMVVGALELWFRRRHPAGGADQ